VPCLYSIKLDQQTILANFRQAYHSNCNYGGGQGLVIPIVSRYCSSLFSNTEMRFENFKCVLMQIWCILNVTEHFWLQDIVNHENSILQAEMQYAMKTGQQT